MILQVRTRRKACERARGAHILESTVGGTSEDSERKKASEQGALTNWRAQMEGQVRKTKESERARITHSLESAEGGTNGCAKETSERGALTPWRARRADTSQDNERKQVSKGHSHPGEYRGRDKSRYRKKASDRGMRAQNKNSCETKRNDGLTVY